MRCWAISDLHLGYKANREALDRMDAYPQDWLILGGDLGETPDQLKYCIESLANKFAQILWVPGNHELYTTSKDPCQLVGERRYLHLVELCRTYGVKTPEDPFPVWPGEGPSTVLVPAFLLYDYSFCPPAMKPKEAKAWARESGVWASDERFIHPDPYPSIEAWCASRIETTQARLDTEIPKDHQVVFINHYPLRQDLVRLFKIPRFSIWCGTKATEQWHETYPISTAVYGHLHMRATDWRGTTRFEEVALGYPRHWLKEKSINDYLRLILPHPPLPDPVPTDPIWHR